MSDPVTCVADYSLHHRLLDELATNVKVVVRAKLDGLLQSDCVYVDLRVEG